MQKVMCMLLGLAFSVSLTKKLKKSGKETFTIEEIKELFHESIIHFTEELGGEEKQEEKQNN